MKSGYEKLYQASNESHPARGAWIEMPPPCMATKSRMSHPARGAWIEILLVFDHFLSVRSHPARGAWIEMQAAG